MTSAETLEHNDKANVEAPRQAKAPLQTYPE